MKPFILCYWLEGLTGLTLWSLHGLFLKATPVFLFFVLLEFPYGT